MSPMGPTLELKLTDSAPDTWHIVSHSKCAKCSTLRPFASKNVQIPTVSEFDEIRHGSYISRDDSNDEIRFIIRDLEKF